MAKTRPKRRAASPAIPARDRSPSLIRRELEKEETRRLIMEAARTMFTREGYESTTMRGIADRIGYTATAIYHHFADKHALMLELCAIDFRALGAALTAIGGITDPVERIRQMGRNYVRFAAEHPEQFRFIFLVDRPASDPGDLQKTDPGGHGYEFLKQAVKEAIAARQFRPEYKDPDLVAQVLWAAVHGVATLHVNARIYEHKISLRDPEQAALAVCDAVMRGLLRPE